MKKRLILSSIATMAIFGSLVVGGTYALFTSESTTSISVTSGTVNVKAEVTDLALFSNGIQQEGTFENGGTATLSNGSLNLSNITPGDKVTCNLTLTNTSNVNILYRVGYFCEVKDEAAKDDTEAFFNALNINFNGQEKNGFISYKSYYTRLSANETINAIPVSVELPLNTGNEFQEKTTTIKFIVEAVQGNATVTDKEEIKYYVPPTATEITSYTELKKAIAEGENEISLTGDVTIGAPEQVAEIIEAKEDFTLYGNGHSILTDKDRVLNISKAKEGIEINVKDANLSTLKKIGYDRAISIYDTKNATINISNCDLGAQHYPINVAGLSEGTILNVDRSVVSGYCAFQTHSKVIGAFTNCELYGINKFEFDPNGWNDFYTLVFNEVLSGTNGSNGSNVTFKDCNIYAFSLANKDGNANQERLLCVSDNNVTVVLEGNKYFTAFNSQSLENPQYKELTKEETKENIVIDGGLSGVSVLLDGEELFTPTI